MFPPVRSEELFLMAAKERGQTTQAQGETRQELAQDDRVKWLLKGGLGKVTADPCLTEHTYPLVQQGGRNYFWSQLLNCNISDSLKKAA